MDWQFNESWQFDESQKAKDSAKEPSEILLEALQLGDDTHNSQRHTSTFAGFDLPDLHMCAVELNTPTAKERFEELNERLSDRLTSKDVGLKEALKNFRSSEIARKTPAEACVVLKLIEKLIFNTDKPELMRLTAGDRKLLGQQCLQLAVNPYLCSQGRFNTCEMATMEKLLWKREPSAVIAVIADGVLRGTVKGYDGKDMKLSGEPFKKDLESKTFTPAEGDRLFPSQIFQTALVERELKGRSFGIGELKYELRKPANAKDSGERLVAADGRVLWEADDNTPINDPGIDFNRISHIYKSLTKNSIGNNPLVLASKDNLWYLPKEKSALVNMEFVDTKDIGKLEIALAEIDRKKQFPVIIVIAVGSGDERDLHVATLHGYNSDRKKVVFHDQNEREDSANEISTTKLLAMMSTRKLKPWQLPRPTIKLHRE